MAAVTADSAVKRRLPFPIEFYRSAIGKKYVMAITGMGLVLFALAHMVGNLKMYLGASGFDHYAEFLRDLLVPLLPRTVTLWLLRSGLIAMFALHLHATYSLTMMNRRARTVNYQSKRDYLAANFASRSMRMTGPIFLLFLFWHLADLTWGVKGIRGGGDSWKRGFAYYNVTSSLGRPIVAGLYIVANLALGVHLFHGAWSFFQSVGWNNPRFNAWRRKFAIGLSAIIVLGNLSFPIMRQFGVTKPSKAPIERIPESAN